MYNLTQFEISTEIFYPNSATLAKLFMEAVVLSFNMVDVIVVDANSTFYVFF